MSGEFTSVEAAIDAAARGMLARLPRRPLIDGLVEFLVFGLKQAWACLFGGLMLGMILVTTLWWPDIGVHRYDVWFLAALALQAALILGRLETLEEARVILIFHLVGTGMELFKTAMGSWIYPRKPCSGSMACRCSRASCMPASAATWRASSAFSTSPSPAIPRSH